MAWIANIKQLRLPDFLLSLGWSHERVQLTLTQIISRAVYPASELQTSRWIRENSAVCEISGYPVEKITKDVLYTNALSLYEIKDRWKNTYPYAPTSFLIFRTRLSYSTLPIPILKVIWLAASLHSVAEAKKNAAMQNL
jgi:hypothetical protein